MRVIYRCFKITFNLAFLLSFYTIIYVECGSIANTRYTSAATLDQVLSLPNANTPLKSRQYSGFLNIGPKKFIHYYYFEAEIPSGLNSDISTILEKPLIFWTNGGPGLYGLFTEFGPWRPHANKNISHNPYSWTSEASLVFLEQPTGVGFSYATDPSILNSWNDAKAALDNLLTLEAFFKRFPQQMNNSVGFYIASESYGGHYIPQLTLRIFENSPLLLSKFGGFLVGNPYTSYASGDIAMANILWGLQLVPEPVWSAFTASSCQDLSQDLSNYPYFCYNMLGQIFSYANNLNPCGGFHQSALFSKSSQVRYHLNKNKQIKEFFRNNNTKNIKYTFNDFYLSEKSEIIPKMSINSRNKKGGSKREQSFQNPNYDPCVENYLNDYLNRLDVQKALHVLQPNGQPTRWEVCSNEVSGGWSNEDFFADTTSLFSKINVHKKKPKGFKMLVFSGDVDGVCATIGTQQWIYSIAGTSITSLYRPWTYKDSKYGLQQAGFLTTFTNNLAFVTVHFAGHEVPLYQPEKALEMLRNYLDGSFFSNTSSSTSKPTSSPTKSKLISSLKSTNIPTAKKSSTAIPTVKPSRRPTRKPSVKPSRYATRKPSMKPSRYPTRKPSMKPSRYPTRKPSVKPSLCPTKRPTVKPSRNQTRKPSVKSSLSSSQPRK